MECDDPPGHRRLQVKKKAGKKELLMKLVLFQKGEAVGPWLHLELIFIKRERD